MPSAENLLDFLPLKRIWPRYICVAHRQLCSLHMDLTHTMSCCVQCPWFTQD